MEDLRIGLARIRELTETVVPFRETIEGENLIDSEGGKKAVMRYIYKEEGCAIAMVDVEKDFVHQNHFHQEYEVICLLHGEALLLTKDTETDLKKMLPIIIEPEQQHTVCYLKESRVLVITIPASRHFPNFASHGKNE